MRIPPDPLRARLQRAMRGALAATPGAPSPPDPWSALVERRLLALDVPARYGGLELGADAATALGEELGRALAPSSYEDTMLAVDCLIAADRDGAQRDRVAALAAGRYRVAAVDVVPSPMAEDGVAVTTTATGWRLFGTCRALGAADGVNALLVGALLGGRRMIAFVEAPGEGFRLGAAGRAGPHPVVNLEGVALAPEHLVMRADAPAMASTVRPRALLRRAAYLLGLTIGAHRETVAYAGRRAVDGVRVRDFQTVAFGLAALRARIDGARLLVRRTASLADRGEPLALAAVESLALCAELALEATRQMIQWHGAFGLTRASAFHAYFLEASSQALRLGPPEALWREAGAERMRAHRRSAMPTAAAGHEASTPAHVTAAPHD